MESLKTTLNQQTDIHDNLVLHITREKKCLINISMTNSSANDNFKNEKLGTVCKNSILKIQSQLLQFFI